MNQETINSIYSLLPELTLAFAILTVIIVSSLLRKSGKITFFVTVIGLLISLILVLLQYYFPSELLFNGLLAADPFSILIKILVSALVLIITIGFRDKFESHIKNIHLLLFLAASMIAVSSANLIMTFVSLEVISIMLFILLSGDKTLSYKFYIYSAAFSGILLYGISLLYGLTGSSNYYSISYYLANNWISPLTLAICVILIISGFAFRMILFPFSFILPSISEKLSLKNLSLIAVIHPVAVFAVTARFSITVFYDSRADGSHLMLTDSVNWQNMIVIIAVMSLLAGSLVLILQTNIRKVFSYIMIIQAGMILLPLSDSGQMSLASALLNLLTFVINSLGILICIKVLSSGLHASFDISNLKGIGRKYPILSVCFTIFLISTAGLPLTVGFIAKFYTFSLIFTSGYQLAGILSALSSMAYMYFIYRLVLIIFSSDNFSANLKIETFPKIMLLLLVFSTILFGIWFAPVTEFCKYSSQLFGI